MFATILALTSSTLYGTADFLGGLAARSTSVLLVTFFANLSAIIILIMGAALFSPYQLTTVDICWSVAAGLCMGTAIICLYHSLAIGRMSVVAPITALCAIFLPVIVDVTLGEVITPISKFGIFLAFVSIYFIAQEKSCSNLVVKDPLLKIEDRFKPIIYAVVAGIGIGLFYIFTKQTNLDSGLWPLTIVRGVGILITTTSIMFLLNCNKEKLIWTKTGIWLGCGVGLVDGLANMAYIIAVRDGQLSIVATLTSLYPASTLLLARIILGDRLIGKQVFGIILATFSVLFIAG